MRQMSLWRWEKADLVYAVAALVAAVGWMLFDTEADQFAGRKLSRSLAMSWMVVKTGRRM